jgi:hypothetical protein
LRKVPVEFLWRERDAVLRDALNLAFALIPDKKEEPLRQRLSGAPYGSAKCSSELIAFERRTRQWGWQVVLVEVIVGIKRVVAKKIEGRPVELLAAGLGNDADNATGIAAKLGWVVGSQDAELGDGIWVRVVDNAVVKQVVVEAAVEQVVDGVAAIAADIEAAWTGIVIVFWSYAGLERGKVENIAAIERGVANHIAGYHLANGGADGLDRLGPAVHLDANRGRTHQKFQMNAARVAYVQDNVLDLGHGESVFLTADHIAAGLQVGYGKCALIIRGDLPLQSLIHVQQSDVDIGQDTPALVGDNSGEVGALRESHSRESETEQEAGNEPQDSWPIRYLKPILHPVRPSARGRDTEGNSITRTGPFIWGCEQAGREVGGRIDGLCTHTMQDG